MLLKEAFTYGYVKQSLVEIDIRGHAIRRLHVLGPVSMKRTSFQV